MGAKMVSTNGFEAYEGIEQNGKEKGKARKELSNVSLAFSGGASSRCDPTTTRSTCSASLID